MNLDQLARLREVCKSAKENINILLDDEDFKPSRNIYVREITTATAALADIDAEIELLKGTL